MNHAAIIILEDNYTHIFYNDKEAIVFDPSEPLIVLDALCKNLEPKIYHKDDIKHLENTAPRKLIMSITTHRHWDHSSGNKLIMDHCNKVLIGRNVLDIPIDVSYTSTFGEGNIIDDDLQRNRVEIECIFTPCHTIESYCFLLTTDDKQYLVTGDTIFWLGVGMFFEGDGEDMVKNIEKLKNKVSDDVLLLYGHEYRNRNIGFVEKFWKVPKHIEEKVFLRFDEEKRYNPFFNLDKVGIKGTSEKIMNQLREDKTCFNK